MWVTTMDGRLQVRTETEMETRVDEIATRTGLDRSEVVRRLIRLGLDDIDQIGDEALLIADPPQ
jgi:predicted DNA-binding protein